jgi:hypothetical protein
LPSVSPKIESHGSLAVLSVSQFTARAYQLGLCLIQVLYRDSALCSISGFLLRNTGANLLLNTLGGRIKLRASEL